MKESAQISLKYLFYTIRAFVALLIIMVIITVITLPVYVVSILFDREKKLYLFLTRVFIKLFFVLNMIHLNRRIDFNGIKAPGKGEKRIYVINHASLIDGLLLFLMPGNIKFMANEFYAKIPIFGLGISATGNIAVNKKNEMQGVDNYFHACEILDGGYPLVIFPEGHRTRTSKVGKFYNSAFRLALEKEADIVPVVFDTWNVVRPCTNLVRSVDFTVKVLDTMKYEDIKDLTVKEISNDVKSQMIRTLLSIYEQKRDLNKGYYRNHDTFRQIDLAMQKEVIG